MILHRILWGLLMASFLLSPYKLYGRPNQMTSNNSGWIVGAPKEAQECIWQRYAWENGEHLDFEECGDRLWYGIPCYRHRPIKKEESK